MHKPIILGIIIVICCSHTIGITGDYQPYLDLSSQDFQDVLNFISSFPTLCGYQPYKAYRKVVNGQEYIINLQNAAGCTAQVTVYLCQGSKTLTKQDIDPCLIGTLSPNTVQDTLTGGYTVQSDPSGATFKNALGHALSQGKSYNYGSNLVLTETQVGIGTNYRFTFRGYDGFLSQAVIYVPIGGLPHAPGHPTLAYDDNRKPWELTEPSSYIRALNFITDSYPQMKSYTVTGAEQLIGRGVIPGSEYTIGLQKNSHNTIKYAHFRVLFDVQSSKKSIDHQVWIDVANFQVPCLIKYYNDSLQQHPELDGAFLERIQNLKEKEGVSFEFSKGSQKYKVLVYKNGAKLINTIN